jgi:zinc D-Ala-D-Ala carboxypeptidase
MSEFITTPEEVEEMFGKYFTFDELKCKCGCNDLKIDKSLAKILYQFRVLMDAPVIIRSAYRCPKHKNYSSNHRGYAIDIESKDSIDRYYHLKYLITLGITRIGINFKECYIHWDINPYYYTSMNEIVLFGY